MTSAARRIVTSASPATLAPRGDANPAAIAYARTRPASEAGSERSSHYVTMRDGIRIAIDVTLPRGAGKVPAIVRQTRYFRSLAPTWLGSLLGDARIDPVNGRMRAYFVARGYAWIDVDVRGSGASGGVWHSPWSPLEVADGREIVDWIVQQPWSSGRVGTTGNSYDGTAAELLASTGHPALVACAPRCSLYDVYTDIAYPGGVRQSWFTAAWTRANQALDAGSASGMVAEAIAQGHPWWESGARRRALETVLGLVFRNVRSVNGADVDRSVRGDNLDVDAVAHGVEFRDDTQPSPLGEQTADAFSPSAYLDRQRAAGVPMLGISGWFDGAYAHAAIKRHLTLARAGDQLVLGPWNHGVSMNVSPYAEQRRAAFDLDAELLAFFDHHLFGHATPATDAVRYYVMGAETWRSSPVWPPRDVTPAPLYLGDHRTLAWTAATTPARDVLDHDPEVGTGRRSRWRTLVSPFVVADYPDRAQRDKWIVAYRSEPLADDVDIAGHPVVELFVDADGEDGAIFAYLEDETDAGVRYVTEGQLRLVHHATDDAGPPLYTSPAPYRSFRAAGAKFLRPGTVTRVVFDLLPVAHRFLRGHRIRLALATADADHFAPVAHAARRIAIRIEPSHPSALVLPMQR